METVADILLYVVPLLFGVILHEVSHGWVAEKLGDPTARLMGRITLNPISHIDPIGTVVLPAILLITHTPFLFGWAKPVPVNFANLRGGRSSAALVAAAGPISNLLVATVSALVAAAIIEGFQRGWLAPSGWEVMAAEPIYRMARISIRFNLVLMLFNLLPIPPLDGGRILVGLAPYSFAAKVDRLEPYGMLIVLLLMVSGMWSWIIGPVYGLLIRLFLG